MKAKIAILVLLVVAVSLLAQIPASAQCAMCKATIENNSAEGGSYAAGLNKGILYLMAIPYIAFGVVGYFWYKNSKKVSQKTQ